MKLWVDDCRPAPKGYVWCKSVDEAKIYCCQHISPNKTLHICEISLDHDAGTYATYGGGDYIALLTWLEEKQYCKNWNIPTKFHLHSANPVGVQNMRAIIQKNSWKEVF